MGYDDLCNSGAVCGQDTLTCASVGLFVDRIRWPVHQWDCLWTDMLTCATVGLSVDRKCWPVHQWDCLWTGYADVCISGTVCGRDTLTCASVRLFVEWICWCVHQWDCLWTGYTDLCISGTVCDWMRWPLHQWDSYLNAGINVFLAFVMPSYASILEQFPAVLASQNSVVGKMR